MTGNMMVSAMMMLPEVVRGENEEEKYDHVEEGGDDDNGDDYNDDDVTWSWARYVTPRKRRTTA